MGRPEPCVLFSQTFIHSQLDEYVDEVIFSEPIVISSCEFLEQNASSVSPEISLIGATLPPSFALEIFVQCEGETRFRRLCQPFLYSHSSSNILEVEAVVTSHLIVRGSYRSLSLVIYGNTAEDLGQFNIEFDLDSSLSNIVSSMEAKLDDLPPFLKFNKLNIERSLSFPNVLSLPVSVSNISVETKQILRMLFNILEQSHLGDAIYKVVKNVVSAASSFVASDMQWMHHRSKSDIDESKCVLNDAKTELLDLYKSLHDKSHASDRENDSFFIQSEFNLPSSKELMDMFRQNINFGERSSDAEHCHVSQSKKVILGLGAALLLCSGREGCFYFVNGSGMEKLAHVLSDVSKNSVPSKLMLLGVLERATQYSIGCEGFLGWWPRENENVPSGISKGYSQLLKLLLQKQSHDVASLVTYVLHRLRFYELLSRYEFAVLSVVDCLSADINMTSITLNMLNNAKSHLKNLLKLVNSCGPIEDPSPVACASRSLLLGQKDGVLSYKATSSLIASSNCCFMHSDIDSHLLGLLKESGFLPLSAALLASSIFQTEVGHAIDILVDVVSSLEAIFLSLLYCRSGLIFLLLHPELSSTLILSLRGTVDVNKEECVPPRYASVLLSKGFFCDPKDVGIIVETYLRAVKAVDRLLTYTPPSDEFLWILWELCGLSRFECGRQALLSLVCFPEALSVLIEALQSAKELEPVTLTTGSSSLNLAIFHSVAEIFEVIVTDSTASSLASWIEHAIELHRALHASSAGSNRKDAPTRLLEWIEAGVVYHKNGVTGLVRYTSVLASGGDPTLTSSTLVSDSMDVDNVAEESSASSDTHVVENLGKMLFDKSFDGFTLRDSSVAQLTTAFRILAFISENSVVAVSLYDEGAVTIIYAVLVNCSYMLERYSNSYDYLVDEGTDCNSTSDLLLERNREQSIIDLLIPCLVLLLTILRKLQEANEPHKNTKLMNALLRLHREISPRLAACASDMSSVYPDSAFGFGAVCHLIVSALACWPLYGWTPGLFHSLIASVYATSLLAFGPKETCSFLCLLNDMFHEEGVLVWNNGIPLLSHFRTMAVASLLGPHKEKQINWYLQPEHVEVLLSQLTPQLDNIAQIILHYAITSLVVIQDMLRIFIIRLAFLKADKASLLIRPIISRIRDHLSDPYLSETDAYKVYRLLDFLASLLEHPLAKPLLLKEGAVQMLVEVLERCIDYIGSDGKIYQDRRSSVNCEFTMLSWSLPVFKSISLVCTYHPSRHSRIYDEHNFESLSTEDCSMILHVLLRLCQVLPVGRELLACLTAFKDLGSCDEGRSALLTISLHINRRDARDGDSNVLNDYEWNKQPPLFSSWTKLLSSVDSSDNFSNTAIDTVGALCYGALCFCMDGKSFNSDRIVSMKYLFGLPCDINGMDDSHEGNIKYVRDMDDLLQSKITDDYSVSPNFKVRLDQVSKLSKSLLLLLKEPSGSIDVGNIISDEAIALSSNNLVFSSLYRMSDDNCEKVADDYSLLRTVGDKFSWDCPEPLPDRLPQAAMRKLSSLDSQSRRAKGDNSSTEVMSQNAYSRGISLPTIPAGPTRRDSFRQRKPNTSRPPSMHVDDYVARERNVDGTINPNVIAIQRVGTSSGRPPSIHVDEFMARQRERQNPVLSTSAEEIFRAKSITESNPNLEDNKSKPLKPDLDDELQGIDIVFDGEESDSDDKLPFPHPDNNSQHPPVIVEDAQIDMYENTRIGASPVPSVDDNDQTVFTLTPFAREPSESSENKFYEHPDEVKNLIPIAASATLDSGGSGFPSFYIGSRPPPPSNNIYMNSNMQQTGNITSFIGSQGHYDKKFWANQPPLPPLPPVVSQPSDVKPLLPTPFHVKQEYIPEFNNNPTSSASSLPIPDLKYTLNFSPRPPPPPPYSSTQFSSLSVMTSFAQSSFYNQTSTSSAYLPPVPPLPFGRPSSMPLYGNAVTHQPGENYSGMFQNIPQSSLQPLQPPQHPRPHIQVSQYMDHGPSLVSGPTHLQIPPVQIVSQPQNSPIPVYYQPQQQQSIEQSQTDVAAGQELSLQDYFSSPEAIQSLLSDREKLCELLEQHPKLMQLLQEKLGQL